MKLSPAAAVVAVLLTGCAAGRFGAVQPTEARFESCHEMWRSGWPRGVSQGVGPLSARVYELNEHLAFEVGHACRPGQSPEFGTVGAAATGPRVTEGEFRHRGQPILPPVHNLTSAGVISSSGR